MDEIKAYLSAHPTEFKVVYLETGADIKRSDKFDAIDTFGDLLAPVMALDVLAKGMWAGGSINESCSAGHQVLDLTSTKTGVWSWADKDPGTTAVGTYVLMYRWVASTNVMKGSRVCWDDAKLAWSIVAFDKSCPPGTSFTAPADQY
ncbi:hypothetical protein GN244_ATG18566 [Phytophthora infestans]|uniref:Uncharacterized protein n=1 Tax=Phytophthora infestans TaxID=4787 RepID=A0A833SWB0_PHYIN|nr:hypothetical protein GN244_ATG18566 [Phytophthora infestans]